MASLLQDTRRQPVELPATIQMLLIHDVVEVERR